MFWILSLDHNVLNSFDACCVSMFHGLIWLGFWLLALANPYFVNLSVLYNVVMVDLFGGLTWLESQGSFTSIIKCSPMYIDAHVVRLGLGGIITMPFDLSPWMN